MNRWLPLMRITPGRYAGQLGDGIGVVDVV